jgi:hypothetical protein
MATARRAVLQRVVSRWSLFFKCGDRSPIAIRRRHGARNWATHKIIVFPRRAQLHKYDGVHYICSSPAVARGMRAGRSYNLYNTQGRDDTGELTLSLVTSIGSTCEPNKLLAITSCNSVDVHKLYTHLRVDAPLVVRLYLSRSLSLPLSIFLIKLHCSSFCFVLAVVL